jgi:hypothetical protein
MSVPDDPLADLQARLAAINELEAGPHADVPVIRQEITRARDYIETLIEKLGQGEEAYARAVDEDRPTRTPRVLMSKDRFLAARPYVVVFPDDHRPEQVWIPWHSVPPDLRDDVISLASLYRDIVTGRKIGRPPKEGT